LSQDLAPKQATQNTVTKKGAPQEDVESNYLFGNAKKENSKDRKQIGRTYGLPHITGRRLNPAGAPK